MQQLRQVKTNQSLPSHRKSPRRSLNLSQLKVEHRKIRSPDLQPSRVKIEIRRDLNHRDNLSSLLNNLLRSHSSHHNNQLRSLLSNQPNNHLNSQPNSQLSALSNQLNNQPSDQQLLQALPPSLTGTNLCSRTTESGSLLTTKTTSST